MDIFKLIDESFQTQIVIPEVYEINPFEVQKKLIKI